MKGVKYSKNNNNEAFIPTHKMSTIYNQKIKMQARTFSELDERNSSQNLLKSNSSSCFSLLSQDRSYNMVRDITL